MKRSKKNDEREQPGDVLGVSRGDGPKLPAPPSDGSTPQGIDVRGERPRHWGTEDIPQSKGASGIDMGAGGDGTQISSDKPRPTSAADSERRDLRGSTE